MTTTHFETLRQSSYLDGNNVAYIEGLYEIYLQDPDAVMPAWREYFNGMSHDGDAADVSLDTLRSQFRDLVQSKKTAQTAVVDANLVKKELAVMSLITAYRTYGHFKAKLDPLGLTKPRGHENLTLATHGLSDKDLSQQFFAGKLLGHPGATLQDIIAQLESCYCTHVGVEYMHIYNDEERRWLREELEVNPYQFSETEKKSILDALVAADGLEKYLALKYVGQKRFSLEGGDALIPLLRQVLHDAAKQSVEACVIGMAHRGRLNVLVNLIGKETQLLFNEFEGKNIGSDKTGDVKYHLGYACDVVVDDKTIHTSLAFNPSHLEIVAPVVAGAVRAKQFRAEDLAHAKTLPVMIHGDSAVAGQGVVFETINMSQLRGYEVGGSIHIVINNQVGFTTSDPRDTRSSHYCCDVAKVVEMPIFHVNGDDPEAVARIAKVAFAYRQKFRKDVMIDLVCYRRLGHNEADDPSVTQPLMYTLIKKHPVPAKRYADALQTSGIIDNKTYKTLQQSYKKLLDEGKSVVAVKPQEITRKRIEKWAAHIDQSLDAVVDTGVSLTTLKKLGKKLTQVPEGFALHPQVQKLLLERDEMTQGKQAINWGYAEVLAYATLVTEGYHVRLSGEDVGRGTFAHRHVELHDTDNGHVYVPLAHCDKKQAVFEVYNSILSEEAVMAFEYGYATSDPDYLVLWEAQFGDFGNGAQVVIDQFISSGEQKWNRFCGLVLLLPHGYEGMGPEHSSARLERYLQLCAQHNMQVCVPTTPAQIFHLLRRQMVRPARKPLIVMTPKSLLRHKLAVSSLEDLSGGLFQLVIPEVDRLSVKQVTRVIVCSGKVYYDLLQKRRDEKCDHVAIIRVEQLYPFPREALTKELKRYKQAVDVVWCQEEPQNQGAWYQISHHLMACLQAKQALRYVGRDASAAPAVGYAAKHKQEQEALVTAAIVDQINPTSEKYQ